MRILALLALAGCTTSDPSSVSSGTYHLTPTVQEDTCTPLVALGSGDVPITATSQALGAFIFVDAQPGWMAYHYTLPADDGYASTWPLAGQRIDPCNNATANPGNSEIEQFALTSSDAHGFDVAFDRDYVIATACSIAPQTSCHVSYALHYERVGP